MDKSRRGSRNDPWGVAMYKGRAGEEESAGGRKWPVGRRPTIEHRAEWGKNWTGGERRACPKLLIEDEFDEG